jgi:hypothetical protein
MDDPSIPNRQERDVGMRYNPFPCRQKRDEGMRDSSLPRIRRGTRECVINPLPRRQERDEGRGAGN